MTAPRAQQGSRMIDLDIKPMALALAAAERAAKAGEVPVGAVLIDARGAVLAQTANQVETLGDPTAHAELLALRKPLPSAADRSSTIAISTSHSSRARCARALS